MTDTVADVEAISSRPTAGAGPRRRESDAVAMAIISQPTYESGAPQDDLESCGVKAARIEARVCATSTGWGLLAGRPSWMLVLFWLSRPGAEVKGSRGDAAAATRIFRAETRRGRRRGYDVERTRA